MDVGKGDIVGKCPKCGVVKGGDVSFNFPNASFCQRCGGELDKVAIAERDMKI